MIKFMVSQEKVRLSIAFLLVLPLFFQLSTGLYRAKAGFDAHGILLALPIPISLAVCCIGIIMLGRYHRATISLGFIIFTGLLMMASFYINSQLYETQGRAKLLLLIQFIVPALGLVLGQLFEPIGNHESANFEKGFLYALVVVVPVQLFCTLLQGSGYLTSYVYLFSIYQHLQYVPVIFVSAFLVAYCRLWQLIECRKFLLVLAPLMSIYAIASMSMLAVGLLFIGMLGFAIYQFRNCFDKIPTYLLLMGVLLTWGWGHAQLDGQGGTFDSKFGAVNLLMAPKSISAEAIVQKMPNVNERFFYWKYYAENITSSPMIFLFGHNVTPDRVQYPSAHNYYLDFIYNFGAIALLPMIVVLYYVLKMLYRFRLKVFASANLMSVSAVVLFLILVDNSLKVSLRQPYSGVFTFFLLGILITRLSEMNRNAALATKRNN